MNRRSFMNLSVRSILAGASPIPTNAAPIIDSHVHVWEHRLDFPFAKGAKPPAYDNSAEDLLKLMKTNRVARTVLIQVIHYRWDNSYLIDVLRRYPGKFHGVCRVNPEDPAAPDHLSQFTEQGCHGVRLSPDATAKSDWIRGPLMGALWQRCAQLRVPMTLLLSASRLPDVMHWIDKNPDLNIVIDSHGRCSTRRSKRPPTTSADGAISSHLHKNLAHVVPFPSALSLSRHGRASRATPRPLWSQASDVGNRLAHRSRDSLLCSESRTLSRPFRISYRLGTSRYSVQNGAASMAV